MLNDLSNIVLTQIQHTYFTSFKDKFNSHTTKDKALNYLQTEITNLRKQQSHDQNILEESLDTKLNINKQSPNKGCLYLKKNSRDIFKFC
ncbi:MAG: hypothetical protein AB8U66_02860 [Rickettsiales endosymbiont of Dermacentor nuttalli]